VVAEGGLMADVLIGLVFLAVALILIVGMFAVIA
jgi:hypothetical protein